MRRHEVDARGWPTTEAVEDIGGCAESFCHGSRRSIALPVVAHRVAIAIVPLGPPRWKLSDLVAARAAIPGFGNELHGAQCGVLVADLELSLIHISEPTRQAEISYAVFCLKKKKTNT